MKSIKFFAFFTALLGTRKFVGSRQRWRAGTAFLLWSAPITAFLLWSCDGIENGDQDADAHDVLPDDGQPDGEGDAPIQYGSLTVTSTPVEGAEIELDGEPTGQTTPHIFENLPVGAHSILLSYPGRLHMPSPVEKNVTTEGVDVNIFLGYDFTGPWKRQSDGLEVEVVMWHRDRITAYSPTAACPNTELVAHGFSPLGALCVETDDSLSLQESCQRVWRSLGRRPNSK